MPIEFQHPKPGAKVQVIGAGLPRTGTNSFCAAVSILLKGPAYHAGAQYATGKTSDETHILALIDATSNFPYHDAATKKRIITNLNHLLNGYVVTADSGLNQLVPELMELYPNAKVICTTRDRESWAKSMLALVKTSQPRLAGFLFFWIPSLRHLPTLAAGLSNIYAKRYGIVLTDQETALATWDRHHAHIAEVVPEDRLLYYSVKDGWEPLCKALDVPVPDMPFPRLNDADDLDAHFKQLAMEGLKRWTIVFGIAVGFLTLSIAVARGFVAVPFTGYYLKQ